MDINMYEILFLLSIAFLIALIVLGRKQNISYYLMMFVIVSISNLGYATISRATTLEGAIIGHRLTYLGGVFIPIFMLFGIMKFCKLKIPKWFVTICILFSTTVLFFAFSVGKSDAYYRNISIEQANGITYIVKEYGPLHKLFIILLVSSSLVSVGVIIYSILYQKVSKKITLCLLAVIILSLACYVIKRAINCYLDIVTIAYILDEIVILLCIGRIGMYEVSASIANSLEEDSIYGYIIFDNKLRFIGCNKKLEEFIPEFRSQKIDEKIDKERFPILYDSLIDYQEDSRLDGDIFERGDKIFKYTIKELYYNIGNKKVGYFVELIDDTQLQKYMNLLNNYNENLEEEVEKKTDRINQLQSKIILGMSDMIENRDNNTGGHIKRTSEVVKIFISELIPLSREFGVSKEFLKTIAKVAPMHDLGKIAVDDSILRKPGKFTPEEFEAMKKHSEKGAEIISQMLEGVEDDNILSIARNIAHYHHEKWNGQGYPCKLAKEDIPIEARIMALADVFDALVSKRCYKEQMDYDNAFNIIEESLGSHFDPRLGKIFLECRIQLENFYNNVAH